MKYLVPVLFTVALFSSCDNTGKALNEKISDADSVAINYFKGDGTMDTVVAVKIIRDQASILKLTTYICNSVTGLNSNCGNDGSIHYFKNNMVIQDINFRMSDDCSQFSFRLNGKYAATKLSADAKGYITGLK